MNQTEWLSFAAICGLLIVGCTSSSEDGSDTTGRFIVLKTRVEIKDDLRQARANSLGWSVAVSKAYLSIGALYYYSGDPVLSQRVLPQSPRKTIALRLSDFLVKPAHAHPGHYIEGAAMGQMLEPTTVDLLGGPVRLADGEGVTGVVNSARFTWQFPPKGAHAAKLGGHVIFVEGTASKNEVTFKFVAKADEKDVINGDKKAEVAGCALGETPGSTGVEMTDDGTVTLTLVPSVWLDWVDFSYAAPGTLGANAPDEQGVVDIAGTLAWQGFIRGVKKGTAYEFSYKK